MMKRLLMLMLAFLAICPAVCDAESTEPYIAYFEKTVFLRPEPAASSESLASIPALTAVELFPVNERFARVTFAGKTGYVYCAEAKRLPETMPVEPYPAYLPQSKYLFALPMDGAASLMTIQAEMPVLVTGETERFLRVEVEGKSGYVYRRDAAAIDGISMKATDAEFYAETAVAALQYPLRNAPVTLMLEPGRCCIAQAQGNGYYRVVLGDETVYVPVRSVVTIRVARDATRMALVTPQTLLFTSPEQSARSQERMPESRLMLLDPQENGFQRLRGTEYCIRINDVTAWAVERLDDVSLLVQADAELRLAPDAGAPAVGMVQAGQVLPEVYATETWYLLPAGEGWGFLPREDPAVSALICDLKMMRTAAVTGQEAAFYGEQGTMDLLPGGMRLVLTDGAGAFYRAEAEGQTGFVHRDSVRILGSDTELTAYTVKVPADVAVMDFPDAALGQVVGVIPAGEKLRVTGFNRCYLIVSGGGYIGYARQEGLLTEESQGIPETETTPRYELVLDKSTGMCYAFRLHDAGARGEVVICAKVGVGKRSTPTPTGTFLLGRKERWHAFSLSYTPHTTEYVRARYIHGWPCVERRNSTAKASLMVTGMVTGGCLRSPFEFAEWVYKNCPSYVTQLTIVSGGFEPPTGAEDVQVR